MHKAVANLPLVSIIVPVCNGERYLRESLDSILAQTYPCSEVIVMDDCSTDGTPAIVASYGSGVKSRRQAQNRGIYGNANDGIALARGEYIAVYHADDVYGPQIVEREVEFLGRYPEAGAVFASDILIDPLGREEGHLVLPPEVRGSRPLAYPVIFNALLKYKNRFLMCPSSMVRASVYRELGVYRDQQFRNTSDLDMWLRIAQKYPIGVLEEHLFRYRFGHGNSAQRYHRQRTEPERYFLIMDLYLAQGGRNVAAADALAAHEGHRSEDGLMRTVNAYVLGRTDEARRILKEVRAARLLGSPVIERWRLLVLFLALKIFVSLPRIPFVAALLSWRWHGAGRRKRGQAGPRFKETPIPVQVEEKLAR